MAHFPLTPRERRTLQRWFDRAARNGRTIAHLLQTISTEPVHTPHNWCMGKPRWSWAFLRPLGMGLGWVVFQNVPGEIQRHYAKEIAEWDVRLSKSLELWPGVSLTVRPRHYPTAAFIVSGPTGPAGLEMSRVAMELGRIERNEEARLLRQMG